MYIFYPHGLVREPRWLSGRASEVNYRDMWTSLIVTCPARNLQMQVSVIHIDFEKNTMHTLLLEI